MMNNYFNPLAMNSDSGWKPQGFLGGMMWSQDNARKQEMLGLQQMLIDENLRRQRAENTTYEKEEPVREAERGSKIGKFGVDRMVSDAARSTPGYGAAMVGGQMGEARVKDAQGQLAMHDMEGQKQLAQQERVGKMWENTAQQLEYARSMGGLNAQAQWDSVYKTLPAGVREHFNPAFDAQTPEKLKALSESVMNNVAQRRKMAEAQLQSDTAIKVGQGNNRATVEAAEVRSLYNSLGREQRAKLDNITATLIEKLANGTITEQEMRTLQYIDAVKKGQNAASASTAMDPNYLRWLLLQGDRTPPARPQPQATPVPAPKTTEQGGGAATSDAEIKAKVEASGEAYDPSNFQYRVDPQTGKLQKREIKKAK